MKWTAEKIRGLRLRLGWSAAEFARRVGRQLDIISQWEKGDLSPSPEDLLHMERLEFYLESYCKQISLDPLAESFLQRNGFAQIHTDKVYLAILAASETAQKS